jgi:hypothetical protein
MFFISAATDAAATPFGAISAVVLVILTLAFAGIWASRRDNISGAKEVTDAALLLITPQSDRISELTAAVVVLNESIDALTHMVVGLEANVKSLSAQVVSLGHTPVLPYHRFPTTNNKDT